MSDEKVINKEVLTQKGWVVTQLDIVYWFNNRN